MEEEFIIRPSGTLTVHDEDVFSGMMIVFAKSMDKIVRILETHYELMYRAHPDYKELVRRKGLIKAREILGDTIKDIMRQSDRLKLGKILECAKEFHKAVMSLETEGIRAHDPSVKDWDAFDAMQNDTNWLCYAYALTANCKDADSGRKIIEFIQSLADDDVASERVLERLELHE